MAAPPITLNRGSVSYSLAAIDRNGFRITGTVTQSGVGADWSYSFSVSVQDRAVVDDNDESYRDFDSGTLPFNEAPGESQMFARMQQIIDEMFDKIPTPTPPSP